MNSDDSDDENSRKDPLFYHHRYNELTKKLKKTSEVYHLLESKRGTTFCQVCEEVVPANKTLAGHALEARSELASPRNEPHTLDLATQFPYLNLTGRVRKIGKHPVDSSGGFADIWFGEHNGAPVAIKVLRHSLASLDSVTTRRVFREMKAWSRSSHPNVLPLLGFSSDLGRFPALVSPWQPNGTAPEYLRQKANDVISHIVIGATCGLEHLHREGIKHGDFKGSNILVSADGNAVICDFGLSKTATHTFGMTTSSGPGGNMRWMAPELFEDNAMITEESDVWSCGMTIFELFSGRLPFHDLSEMSVFRNILTGALPKFPSTVEDLRVIENTCKMCWVRNPEGRPTISQVLFALKLQTMMWTV